MVFLLLAMAVPSSAQFSADFQTNTITGGLTDWAGNYIVGSNKVFDVLQVTAGGVLTNASGYLGYETTASNNFAVVDGGGSVWSNVGTFAVGNKGSGNQLVIRNSGRVLNTSLGYLGVTASSSNNVVIVTGTGSIWTNGSNLYVGQSGFGNQLMILEGGLVVDSTGVIGKGTSRSNLVVVSGANSLWKNSAGVNVGGDTTATTTSVPSENALIVTNGGWVVSSGGIIGNNSNANLNLALISGSGSTWTNVGGAFTVGAFGSGNRLVISNGGFVYAGNTTVGSYVGSTNNEVRITGAGSLWVVGGSLAVGTNANSKGNGRVLVTDEGTLQPASLIAGFNGTGVITNSGGVLQFASAAPTITPNGYGNIVVTNGTISFVGINSANVWGSRGSNQVGNILFQGDNLFRLNNASNTSAASPQNYTFAGGISPSNYVGLEMINGGTAWRSAWLNVGADGSLLVSNSTSTVDGVLTNQGTLRVVNGTATWKSNVVLNAGSYTFAGATNTFSAGLQIGSGALFGGSGRVVNNGAITNAGILAPGNSPGTMVFSSNLTLLGSSELRLEIGSDGLSYDRLVVEGTLTKGGTVLVTNLGYNFVGGESFDFIDATNWAGSFNLLPLPPLPGGMTWNTTLFEGQGILSVVAIPEPSTLWGLGAALGVLVCVRRRMFP